MMSALVRAGRLGLIVLMALPWAVADCGGSSTSDGGGPSGTSGAGGTREEVVVTAADGQVVLTIPIGALPEGVTADEIEIVPLAESDVTLEGLEFIAGYELLPDGLVLSEAASLEWTLTPPEGFFLFLHSSRDDIESPDANLMGVDGAEAVYELEISHFSRVVAMKYEGVAVGEVTVLKEANDAPVGGLVSASFQVSLAPAGGAIAYQNMTDVENEVRNVLRWQDPSQDGWHTELQALRKPRERDVLLPVQQSKRSSVEETDTQVLSAAFRCNQRGDSGIRWVFQARWEAAHSLVSASTGEMLTEESAWLLQAFAHFDSMVECTAPNQDPAEDFIDSILTLVAAFTPPWIDLTEFAAQLRSLTQPQADELKNNSLYECGETDEHGRLVVCPAISELLEAGDVLVATMTLAADVPLGDAEHSYIYSLVIDSDGDPANDWQFQPPYDGDLFQGADRWYELVWNHQQQTWELRVTQVTANQTTESVASGAWAVIDGPHINFFVPGAEFDPEAVRYRLTAFGHDGNFSEDDRGADASGVDAREPLRALDAN